MRMPTIPLPRPSQEMPIPPPHRRPLSQSSQPTQYILPKPCPCHTLPPLSRRPHQRRLPHDLRGTTHRPPLHRLRRSNRRPNKPNPSLRMRPTLRRGSNGKHQRSPHPNRFHRRLRSKLGPPRRRRISRPHRPILDPTGRLQRDSQRTRTPRRGCNG